MEKSKIIYPCLWSYLVIGASEKELREVVKIILKDKQYSIFISNKSKSGKYISLSVQATVASEVERNQIYVRFSEDSAIKKVL